MMAGIDPRICAVCGLDVNDPVHHRNDGHKFRRVTGPPKPEGGGVTAYIIVGVLALIALIAFLASRGIITVR
jgi:hypothetical protein